jgi:hypothetical protein
MVNLLASDPARLSSVPVQNFRTGHHRHAVMAENIIVERLDIFDPVRRAGQIGMDGYGHDARIVRALEVKAIELIDATLVDFIRPVPLV